MDPEVVHVSDIPILDSLFEEIFVGEKHTKLNVLCKQVGKD